MRAVFGNSPAMLQLRQLLAASARSDASVLIQGETGSGKEVVCRELHQQSARAAAPFVALNCAAIPAQLLESELFGYRKGAYTGAMSDRKGRIELAHEGTLLLDEIGDMPLDLQAKLLRFLEDRVVEPLGAPGEAIRVNVRVIAATHKDLHAMVQAGSFREDLFYRLNVIPLYVPPLRERCDELPLLCQYFARHHASGATPIELTQASLDLLARYHWPGNVRELSNLLLRFSVLFPGRVVDLVQLPPALLSPGLLQTLREHGQDCGVPYEPATVLSFPVSRDETLLDYFREELDAGDTEAAPLPASAVIDAMLEQLQSRAVLPAGGIVAKDVLEKVETSLLRAALRQAGNNTQSARLLCMERTTFIQKLVRYGLNGQRKAS